MFRRYTALSLLIGFSITLLLALRAPPGEG